METIVAAAVKVDRTIYTLPRPARHPDILDYIAEIDVTLLQKPHYHCEGFLTSENRFVNRYDAAQIARRAKQIINPDYLNDILYTEDLW